MTHEDQAAAELHRIGVAIAELEALLLDFTLLDAQREALTLAIEALELLAA